MFRNAFSELKDLQKLFDTYKMDVRKQQHLSFDSENLVVDYISFKFQDLEDWKEKKLASYLLKLGFIKSQEN